MIIEKTIFPCYDYNEKHEYIKSYEKGGRVYCDVCESFEGVKVSHRQKTIGTLKERIIYVSCIKCGSKEQKSAYTGKIYKQLSNKNKVNPEGLKVGDLVKWNGNRNGRIDKVTAIVGGLGGGYEYYTLETNPPEGKEARIGKQFYDKNAEHIDKGVGIVKII